MSTALERLLTILDLEPLEHNLFRGQSPLEGWQRVFGGQVIGQALVAATRTVDGRPAHALHAYFMRAGDEDYEITFRVERDFDGGSFSTRRVIALQKDRPILNLAASFQKMEEGLHHQEPMPDVPPPEELKDEAQLRSMFATGWAETSASPRDKMSGSGCATAPLTIPRSTALCSPIKATAGCLAPAHWRMA